MRQVRNCSFGNGDERRQRRAGRRTGCRVRLHAAENIGQVRIELTPFGERRMPAAEIERRWRAAVGDIEGAERVTFTASVARFGDDVEFELAHENEDQLIAAAESMKEQLATHRRSQRDRGQL